jgi:hypothetical protein
MKWFKRIAQGFSPGSHGAKHALKVASESRVSGVAMLIPRIALNLGCHFPAVARQREAMADKQGTSPRPPNPGLKPWAILLNHFMVKTCVDEKARPANPIPY